MARSKRDEKLDTRSARLRLGAGTLYWTSLAPGQALGYRRPVAGGAGSWWARTLRQGSRIYLKKSLCPADDFQDANGTTVVSYAQAQQKAHQWFLEVHARETGEHVRTGPFTVRDAWLAYKERHLLREGKSIERTEVVARAHILPELGDLEVAKLTRRRVEKWHQDLAAKPARLRTRLGAEQNTRTPSGDPDERRSRRDTANRVLTILKAMLNRAKEWGLTQASGEAWREVRPFRSTTKARHRFLSAKEVKRLINGSPEAFKPLITAALHTGARFGELARVQVRDFDASAGSLAIAESKSGHPRQIILTPEGTAFFKSMTTARKPDDPIFLRASHETRNVKSPVVLRAWKHSDLGRPMRQACEAAGLEPLCFHELRHTYASEALRKGIEMRMVAEQLGHTDTRMVEKHYGHLVPSAKQRAFRELGPRWGIQETDGVEDLNIKTS